MSDQRGTLVDPILERIAAEDGLEFERCVLAIAQLGSNAAMGLTHLGSLPETAMNTLASHVSPDVRSGIARHPSCPPSLLRQLAIDSDPSVRRVVAANKSSPNDLLLKLAVDPDEWVRFDVARNPKADDKTKAAFALAASPEMVASAREDSPFLSPEEDPNLSADTLRSMTDAALADINGTSARGRLAKNPSLPEDLLPRLVETATHRWEWGPLWNRGLLQGYQYGSLWPSTHAFLVPDAPLWLLEVLGRHGHPAALIYPGIEYQPSDVEAWLAVRDLINSELLVRALWRELALARRVSLNYWNDTYDGDKFFPETTGLNLMEGNTAAQYLIGGYSDSREWIKTEDTLETYRVIQLASNVFEDWMETQAEEFNEGSLDNFALVGSAWAEELNRVPVRWTEAGELAIEETLWEFIVDFAEPDDMDTTVTVLESRLPRIGYSETSDAQKLWLVELLRRSRSNLMVSTWGLSDHFLMCIALHPDTPKSIRDELARDASESVQQAVHIATARAQGTVEKNH